MKIDEIEQSFIQRETQNSLLWKFVKTQENWHPNWFEKYCLVRLFDVTSRPIKAGGTDYFIIVSGEDDMDLILRSNDFDFMLNVYKRIKNNITIKQLIEWGFGE